MAVTPLNYDDIRDFRYNPFTGEFTPKQIGYGGNPAETRAVPSSAPYHIKLYESPQENVPSTTRIIRNDTSVELTEVSKTTSPSASQYRVNYDELGNGIAEFHPSLKSVEVDISYYALGHLFQKISLDTRVPSTGDTTIAGNKTLTGDNTFSGENDFQSITCTTIKINDNWSAVKLIMSHGNVGSGATGQFVFGSVDIDNNSDIAPNAIIIPRKGIYHVSIEPERDGTAAYYRIYKNTVALYNFYSSTIMKLSSGDSMTFFITNTTGGTLIAAGGYRLNFHQISNELK